MEKNRERCQASLQASKEPKGQKGKEAKDLGEEREEGSLDWTGLDGTRRDSAGLGLAGLDWTRLNWTGLL
jgi:hypothetical protein